MLSQRKTMILISIVASLMLILACNAGGRGPMPPTLPPVVTAGPDGGFDQTPTPTPADQTDPPDETQEPGDPDPGSSDPGGSDEVQRISFAAGATSATVNGHTEGGFFDKYVIYILAGQDVTIDVESSEPTIALTVVSPLGSPLMRGEQVSPPASDYHDVVPETGDYQVMVRSMPDTSADFTMTITILPLGSDTGPCTFVVNASLQAYSESSLLSDPFGAAGASQGESLVALGRTLDDWIAFDPAVAQAGNEGRARYRWFKTLPGDLTFESGCDARLPLLLDKASIENDTYDFADFGEFTLSDGTYTNGDPINTRNADLWTPFAWGDVNGDGAEDAVFFISLNTGGTGHFVHLVASLNVGGHPTPVTPYFIDDRPIVNGVSIEDGTISADLVVHSESAPLCCPDTPVIWDFVLSGDELEMVE